ncbi:ABC transporter permease [Microbacterium mitrae]|uniref:ABC transporter permease n=1 Tax=Microbacterium mitrae TaxID=664640 RepID=A0A5C8HTP5_9MICO|nr:ABC transporter permease [Microbacterium mitrae]TXK06453.1 ABC transporter permease [Microbacterium mitrae]
MAALNLPTRLEGQGPAEPRRAPKVFARFRRAVASTPATIASATFLVLLILAAIFAPLITGWIGVDPYTFNEDLIDPMLGGLPIGPLGGISAEHPFGVEPLNGRDLFARVLFGARTSLLIAAIATILTATIGVLLGVLAGYFGRTTDMVISRITDFIMAFPALIFMIAILSAVPEVNRMVMLIIVLSVFGWPAISRVVRGQVMSVKNREFVEAARASGASRGSIIFREVLPNVSGTIIVMVTLMIPSFIATEAGLSFLGVGVRPPEPSWGQMIFSAVPWFSTSPMFFIIPGTFLTLTVLSCMIIGDELERQLGKTVAS